MINREYSIIVHSVKRVSSFENDNKFYPILIRNIFILFYFINK